MNLDSRSRNGDLPQWISQSTLTKRGKEFLNTVHSLRASVGWYISGLLPYQNRVLSYSETFAEFENLGAYTLWVQLINATLGDRGNRQNKTQTREWKNPSCSSLKNDCLCSYQILQNISHLTKEQRYTIFVMKQQGFRNNQIANVICKDKSVISRELKRNCDKRSGQYRAEQIWTKNEREAKVDQVHKRAMPACRDNVERGLQSGTELEWQEK